MKHTLFTRNLNNDIIQTDEAITGSFVMHSQLPASVDVLNVELLTGHVAPQVGVVPFPAPAVRSTGGCSAYWVHSFQLVLLLLLDNIISEPDEL